MPLIEQGPTYQTGGITTLMSVGNGDDGINISGYVIPRPALYAGGGYVLGKVLGLKGKAKWLALVGLGVGLL